MTSTVLSQTSESIGRILASVKLTGAVLSVAHLEAPFTVASAVVPTGVFHAVMSGEAWASLADAGEAVHLGAGQVAVFPAGAEHLITSAPEPESPPVPVSASGHGPIATMNVMNGGAITEILCGTITFADSPVLAVADVLPQMVVTGTEASNGWVRSTVELISEELIGDVPASKVVAERLADVLVVRALREMVQSGIGDGWMAGVRDAQLAPALAAIHSHPERPWTATSLARLSSMSRSSFYERFRRVMGIPPAEYLATWRVHVACGLLETTDQSIGSIGRTVGFTTEAGFSTAFKRMVGVPPSAHRRALTHR
ncbi:MAG: cupin domain-containing protein [Acidimicrobiia bacterium]